MTNINCSSNCIYQKDGKCQYSSISSSSYSPKNNCAYFIEKTIPTPLTKKR